VQTLFGPRQADFAKAVSAAAGLKLAELTLAAGILSSPSLQNSRACSTAVNRHFLSENASLPHRQRAPAGSDRPFNS
jgi:hypothetical protein